ncbi:MAG: phosphate signaling complex protein PhoU [Acidimicrobiaceae bacterium]|nr:phosphate signaling complex protein PhoU [Acidimicrobiaceae bacterium]MBT5849804.1 phosphate signaling complex protein PhoU [Acidimicrobiaceae bacterium]
MTTIPTGLTERLAVIEQDLLAMVEMVVERVGLVTSALLEGDVATADQLVDADDDIDLLSYQVEEGCIAALVREQPLQVDLRFVVAAMHINMDVERSGDLVSNIAKAVGRLQGSRPDDQMRDLVARMSAQAQLLMRRAAESLRTRDSTLAESIDELDDVLDDLHYYYTQHVISDARRGGLDPQQSLQLALVGRFYERIGDHAENVGERVRYIVDGWLPEIQAAQRARTRSEGPEPRPTRGLAVIDSIAESRRVDAIRRDFVANVSHELKTPVGAISLLAEALEGDQDVEDRKRLTEMLRREATRVGDIIDDLLELTRLEETETSFDVLDLDLIVHAAIEKVRSFADGNGVEISTVGLPAELSVSGDRRQLVRALTNLLDNAVRYSDPEQLIVVSVEAIEDGASITVKDDGVGIPRAELERVFERFYRVDRARSRDSGGTGLGLAIVRHVAQNHGGKVLVESKPDEGSSFSMHLPAAGTVNP